MLTLTDRAAAHLDSARKRGELRYQDLRVVVRRVAEGGLEYALHWVAPDQALPGDVVAECGPIRIHVEIHSAAFLRDARLDYVYESGEADGFRLETSAS